MRLALSGGGTGGHVYPALAVAEALRNEAGRDGTLEIIYLGSKSGFEREIVNRAGIVMHGIESAPIRGRMPWEMAANAGRIAAGTNEARAALGDFQPQVVLATGGYASFPVALAARSRGIPLVVYLPDVYPGWAVRAIARLAQRVCATAVESLRRLPAGKSMVTGYPVRHEFWEITRPGGRERFGVNPEEKVLFIAGGSTGAHNINTAVANDITGLLELAEVIHICGPKDESWLRDVRAGLPDRLRERYHLHGYMHSELHWAMAAADLALCRSGASALGELPAAGLPAILVPLPISGGHQRPNARYMEKHGAAVLLEDAELNTMLPLIANLLHDEARLRAMRDASRRLARPDAAMRIGRELIDLAGGRI
jgi:UDP-N-acetylglucosamine--N-acetylmuramyl-(pentapeptide) pyrophosphoryl-undecaprenol N-acetylglucosamine transferase